MASIQLNKPSISYEQQFKDSAALACISQAIADGDTYTSGCDQAYRIAEYLWAERTKRYGQA